MIFLKVNGWSLAVLCWVGLIFFSSTSLAQQWADAAYSSLSGVLFSNLPVNTSPSGIMHLLADKAFHVTLFCILAWLLWQALQPGVNKPWIILVAGAIVGSCSEFLQRFFPGRDPALRDVVINIAGIALGILLSLSFERMRLRSKQLVQS